VALWLAVGVLALQPAMSQEAARPSVTELKQSIEASRARVQDDTTLDDAARARATGTLDKADAFLKQAAEDFASAQALAEEQAAAPVLIREGKEKLSLPARAAQPVEIEKLSDAELEISLSEAEAAARSAQERASSLNQELNESRSQRPALGTDLAKARDDLDAVRDTIAQIQAASVTRPGTGTSILLAQAEELAVTERIKHLEVRRDGADLHEQLLIVRMQLAQREAAASAANAALLRKATSDRRRAQVSTEAQIADRVLFEKYPRLKALAAGNAEIAAAQVGPESPRQLAARSKADLRVIEKQITVVDDTRKQVDTVLRLLGRSTAAEKLIVDTLDTLPANENSVTTLQRPPEEVAQVQMVLVDVKRELVQLERDPGRAVTDLLQSLPDLSPEDEPAVRLAATELISSRLRLLQQSSRDADLYLAALTEQREQQQRLAAKVSDYREYLLSRQVWVPSLPPIEKGEITRGIRALPLLSSPALWDGAAGAMARWQPEHSYRFWLFLAVVAAALLISRRIKIHSAEFMRRGPPSTGHERIRRMILPPVLRAGCWAFVVYLTAQLLGLIADASPENLPGLDALSEALPVLAVSVFTIPLIRALYAPAGPVVQARPELAEVAARARRSAARLALAPIAMLGAFLCAVAYRQGLDEDAVAATRICLILAALAIAWGIDGLLRPGFKPLGQSAAENSRGYSLLSVLGYLAAMSIPVAFVLAVLAGYALGPYDAARAIVGTAAILGVYLAARTVISAAMPTVDPAAVEDGKSDLLRGRNRLALIVISIIAGLAMIWVWDEVLEALGYLKSVPLWWAESSDGVGAVTVADLFLFLVVLGGSLLAFWALPVIFGTRTLDLSMKDVGPRYATVTLVRYVVLIAGVLVAFSMLRVNWSHMQWLAAGLSVGLGFGLQESVANFVAGLMLLTEQQVRIGDVIAIGDKSGVVTRIQVRATTVKDFDGRELIIPNKDLVTTQVTNWTLTDTRRRVQVAVGVAYGSDPDVVERLLLEAASKVPWVSDVPQPNVVFELFGADAIHFRLYVWIESGSALFSTVDSLHREIDRIFRENGITIAFPQRDVHLVADMPVSIQMVAPGHATAATSASAASSGPRAGSEITERP
jgi:potassium efflux system protein